VLNYQQKLLCLIHAWFQSLHRGKNWKRCWCDDALPEPPTPHDTESHKIWSRSFPFCPLSLLGSLPSRLILPLALLYCYSSRFVSRLAQHFLYRSSPRLCSHSSVCFTPRSASHNFHYTYLLILIVRHLLIAGIQYSAIRSDLLSSMRDRAYQGDAECFFAAYLTYWHRKKTQSHIVNWRLVPTGAVSLA